jgi:hypothetical protein
VNLVFSAPVFYWRGPAPFHFVALPEPEAAMVASASGLVTYGWGMIPVHVSIGATEFTTSMWPKDGGYYVPIKTAVRRAEQIDIDDVVEVTVRVDV